MPKMKSITENINCSWSTCSATFSTEDELQHHYETKHCVSQTSNFKCILCYMKFSRLDCLERHQRVKHKVSNYNAAKEILKYYNVKSNELEVSNYSKDESNQVNKEAVIAEKSVLPDTLDVCNNENPKSASKFEEVRNTESEVFAEKSAIPNELGDCKDADLTSDADLVEIKNRECRFGKKLVCKFPFNQKTHDVQIPEENRHVCHHCAEFFTTKKYLLQHIRKIHRNKDIEFTQLASLRKHNNRNSTRKSDYYECNFCGKRFSAKTILKRHIINLHINGNKTYECLICRMKFMQMTSLRKHTNTQHNNRNGKIKRDYFECNFCGIQLLTKAILNRHIINLHVNENKYKCLQCSELCITMKDLKQHVRTIHSTFTNKHMECLICGKEFTQLGSLRKHYTLQHRNTNGKIESDYYDCNYCAKRFLLKTNLKRHIINLHVNGNKIFECTICSVKFNRRDSLKRHHQMKHTANGVERGNKGFECDICKKRFSYKVSVERHITGTHMPKSKIYPCTECNATFAYVFGLKRHFKTQHSREGAVEYICDVCNMKFRRRDNLKRHSMIHELRNYECPVCLLKFNRPDTLRVHEKKKHPKNDDRIVTEIFTCYNCGKKFTSKICVKQHIQNMHLKEREKKFNLMRNKCAKCELVFRLKSDLIGHYQENHGIEVESENVHLSTFAEFIEWKRAMEKRTYCKYNRLFIRRLPHQQSMTYVCHRSGVYNPISERKRRLKQTGTKKIGALCPAELKVNQNADGTCDVKYTKTHIGHEVHHNELVHVRYDPEECNLIASKIAAGVPYSRIKKDLVKNPKEGVTGNLEKIHLLKTGDIRNIALAKKLNKNRHRAVIDEIGVECYVEQYVDSVLYYKKMDEIDRLLPELEENDFVLIIMNKEQKWMLEKYANDMIVIDGTYDLVRYNYVLQSVLVVDSNGEPFPCCFTFSNRNDETIVKLMLQCIRNEVGTLQANILMTDTPDMYYRLWVQTMNCEPVHRLFSPWNVKRSWKKFFTKITCPKKRKNVSKLFLHKLHREQVIVKFEKMLAQFLEDDDPDVATFKQYFEEHFVNTKTSWATCYRIEAGVLTPNNNLELLHRIVKNIYSKGNKVRNLQDALQALQCYMTEKVRQISTAEVEEVEVINETDLEKCEEVFILSALDENVYSNESENQNEDLVEELQTTYIIEGEDTEQIVEQLRRNYLDRQLYCNECEANSCPHIDSVCVMFSRSEMEDTKIENENTALKREKSPKPNAALEKRKMKCKQIILERLQASSSEEEIEILEKVFVGN